MPTSNIPHISKNRLTDLRKLLQKKYRREERKFIVEGAHLIEEAIASGEKIESILFTEPFAARHADAPWLNQASRSGVNTNLIDERDFASISDTVTSQGVIAVVAERRIDFEQFRKSLSPSSLIVALDGISDPGNLGTIIRTCDWFGVDAILLGEGTVDLFNQKVLRATQGSVFHLPIFSDLSLPKSLRSLKSDGCTIFGTSMQYASSLTETHFPERSVIVLGSEAAGISAEVAQLADQLIIIPGFGKAESLNVSIACGVILGFLRFSKGLQVQ